MQADFIYSELFKMFPDAKCELEHRNAFELCVAVLLSAQTTDKSVNKVTPALFDRYPSPYELAKADAQEVEGYIHSIGLYRNKSRNIIKLSQELIEQFDGEVPHTMKELTSLSGIGRKSANVVLLECFNVPSVPVDTHVERVSKRLKIAKEGDSVLDVERKIKRKFKREQWGKLHHLLIFFGRYKCKAQNPDCTDCPFFCECRYQKTKKEKK